MSGYEFRVYDIEWEEGASSKTILPDEAVVLLSKWLVEADHVDDDEWDDAINGELRDQLGATATSFSYELYDSEDDED